MTGRSLLALTLMAILAAGGSWAAETKPKPAPLPAADKQQPRKRQRVINDLSGFELLDAAKLRDKPVVAGATRDLGSEPPVILAPHLARLHGVSPVFAWRHAGERFAFVLSDELGQDVFAAEVTGHSYAWPAGAPRLVDGQTYLWSVRPAGGPATALASMAAVVVVTPAEREAVDKALAAVTISDPYDAGLTRARALMERRVWYDALGALADLIERSPDRPQAYELRALLFAQIPATQAEAEADFARADELTNQ